MQSPSIPVPPLNQELIFKIAHQQANFEVLLENMSQGVCMYRRDRSIVFHNRRFFEIFGLAETRANHVTSLQEVLELRVRSECYPDMDACEYVQQCLDTIAAQQQKTTYHMLRNGACILEKHIPFEDGGWLTCFEDISEFHALKQEIEYLAMHDQLTGLGNRHRLIREIELLTAGQLATPALLYLDLDGFKDVNDRYGHRLGDRLLKAVAQRLQDGVEDGDSVVRLGGDEFAILCNRPTGRLDAEKLARRLIERIEQPFAIDGRFLGISASIGVYVPDEPVSDFEILLSRADTAMYAAKRAGRGGFRFFEPEAADREANVALARSVA